MHKDGIAVEKTPLCLTLKADLPWKQKRKDMKMLSLKTYLWKLGVVLKVMEVSCSHVLVEGNAVSALSSTRSPAVRRKAQLGKSAPEREKESLGMDPSIPEALANTGMFHPTKELLCSNSFDALDGHEELIQEVQITDEPPDNPISSADQPSSEINKKEVDPCIFSRNEIDLRHS